MKRLVDLVPDFRLGVEVLRALEKIMLGAREEHFERLRANVEVESFRCIIEMLDPRFAFEFGEKLTVKVMDMSWPEEVDSHYLDYAKFGLNSAAIDSSKCMQRYKDCILSSQFGQLVDWLLAVYQKCVEANLWMPSAEDKILVEEPLSRALQDGSGECRDAVGKIARAYGYDPDVLQRHADSRAEED